MLLRLFKVESAVIEMILIEFSIPDYNKTIIKNIFKHWTSWVVFRTQWFIGQYCSEREGRGYRCCCTSVPLSLYFISILWLHFPQMTEKETVFPFPNNHRRPSKVLFLFLQRFSSLFSTFSIRPSIPSLFHCPTGHESRRFQCQSRIKIITH